MDLFKENENHEPSLEGPLADRMRPRSLSEFIGQDKIMGPGSLLRRAIDADRLFSMILWGPPGCGKTTLARLMARQTSSNFVHFSAVLSGVKQIRQVIDEARRTRRVHRRATVLFVDEIHRFNKSQQDAFLHHVESGLITLIGATTENPSFEVIAPLLSRCRVIRFEPLNRDQLLTIVKKALADRQRGLGKHKLNISPKALEHLVRLADGDARAALNNLELAAIYVMSRQQPSDSIEIEDLEAALAAKAPRYDKSGDQHYDLISAFHKSLRGSDPDASLYWLARMLTAGEDPLYIARRMVRFASEDVGNADPYALQHALSAMEAYRFLGSPEGELALAQAAVYLATAPKSNTVYKAFSRVVQVAGKTGSLPVPLHIRNAPTGLMRQMGHGKGYKYAHDYDGGFIPQHYLPEQLQGNLYYFPKNVGYEKTIKQRLDHWRSLIQKNQENKAKQDS